MVEQSLPRVDYETAQHAQYAVGRVLSGGALSRWMAVFSSWAARSRPLAVLDLGSGTGRFTPALAREFGGPVYGVEPAGAMRRQAPAAPGVTYLDGRAEDIPLGADTCDLILMFLSLHHVEDRAAAGREVGRVLRPGGRLLVCTALGDRIPPRLWHRFYPGARSVEERLVPTYAQVLATFPGLDLVAHDRVEGLYAPDLAAYAARIKRHTISTFEYLDAAEIAAGDARLDAAVAADAHPGPVTDDLDLLVFEAR
jgi:SAM-dependent methyltransferase